MSRFYISKVTAYKQDNEKASVQLKDGVNIIYGPSNTGKTLIIKYINFLFGAKDNPDSDMQIDRVSIDIKTELGSSAIISRKFDENKIYVSDCSIEGIKEGEYSIQGKNSISNVYLSLIGIKSPVNIFSTQDYTSRQTLTWNSLKNFFFLSESNVANESIYYANSNFHNPTAELGCLQFLINGIERKLPEEYEDSEKQSIKKAALIEYIKQELDDLEERKKDLVKGSLEINGTELEIIIKEKNQLLTEATANLNKLLSDDSNFGREYSSVQEEIYELELLLDRLYELETQYNSDIERLNFIIDGEKIRKTIPQNTKCPYCENILQPKTRKTYILAETKELAKIQNNLQELRETINYNEGQKSVLYLQLENINSRRAEISQRITEIKSEIQGIVQSVSELKNLLKLSSDIEAIDNMKEKHQEKLKSLESMIVTKHSVSFAIKSEFEEEFFSNIEKFMNDIIKKTDFESYESIKIDKKTFDLVINDSKQKKNQGKGYRAFLNSLYANALTYYLACNGKYSPGLLLLDSPLLTLKEEERDLDSSDSMKKELMRSFIDYSDSRQIIIVENEIPDIDYSNVNLIEFTKKQDKGRYGFI